jgi:hypothetical protein
MILTQPTVAVTTPAAQPSSAAAWLLLDAEADLHGHLEHADLSVSHRAADLRYLEPVEVAERLCCPRNAVPHCLVDAVARSADDLGEAIGRLVMVRHGPLRSLVVLG